MHGDSGTMRGGWIATPHLRPDRRGPVDRPFEAMPDPETIGPAIARLAAVTAANPAAVAVAWMGGELSFAGLLAAVARISAALPPGTAPVAILLPTDAAYVAAVFGCLAARRLTVMLDAGYPAGRNSQIAAAAGIGVILTDAATAARLDWTDAAVVVVDPLMDAAAPVPPLTDGVGDMDAPAFMLATSGSTGMPKLIVHSERTMLHWVVTTHNDTRSAPGDRALSLSSFSSLGGFTALMRFPLAGVAMQVLELASAGLGALVATLRDQPVTMLRGAPSLLRGLAGLPDAAATLAGLRTIQGYGEPLLLRDVAALRAVLPPGCLVRTTYGSTEASGLSWYVREDDAHHPVHAPGGILMPDTEARIVRPDGSDCARGEAGELIIRSRYNALGEWQDGRLVPGRLQPDPDDPRARIYATGDLARCDADGVFVILGRADRMLNINGVRVEPAEIERALAALPGVATAVVMARTRGTTQTVLGFLQPVPGVELDSAALKARLRKDLPGTMVPSRLIVVAAMPLLPGGKVDGQALLALADA